MVELSDDALLRLALEFGGPSAHAVVLVGSLARGDADAYSDVDLKCFVESGAEKPRDWFGQGKCVMSLHGPIAIDPALAAQWADAMRRAIDGQPGLEADFRDKMTEALRHMALSMINRAGQGSADAKVAASG